jgi:amino acid adenylation domain-containing protein
MSSPKSMSPRHHSILGRINTLIHDAIPSADGAIDPSLPFLEMGANSLVLMDVQRTIKSEFGVEISIGQFFEELTNIEILVQYLDENTAADEQPAVVEAPVALPAAPIATAVPAQPVVFDQTPSRPLTPVVRNGSNHVSSSELESIFTAQLEATSRAMNELIQQQLAWITGAPLQNQPVAATLANTAATNGSVASQAAPSPAGAAASKPATASSVASTDRPVSAIQPQKMLSALETRARGLTPKQQAHLEKLINDFNTKTASSKLHTQKYRPVLADSRAAIGFRFSTKEMLYPIVSNRSRGARIWDIDGNEYIDISMGQGVSLFGHHPEFIESELRKMVDHGVEMGPRPDTVGEVAELICEMTGFDRVTFTNSGTEAVMAVMRLARAATKRDKIVSFEGAWHGHADSVMGMRVEEVDGVPTTKPVSPGTPAGAVADQWVLSFDDPASLDFIRRHASSIAAVLVEPVQSRNPRVQPKEFLQELRRITTESGSLLIFDEMITGFRAHPQGAQGWFGVKADMATYGKVIGGGLPIGVVAGRAELMDPIDGGMWNYGDTTYPVVNRVVFGGTFCQHPLAMTAALATLKHLKANGEKLQSELNAKTTHFAEQLNSWFKQEQVPIQVAWFGSLFRFEFSSNFELLFYHMNLRGVFVWEWRNCFLSTAHTQQDLDRVVEVVKESVLAMREGGFIPPKQSDVAPSEHIERATSVPLSQAQKQLATLSLIQPDGSLAYHVNTTLDIRGSIDIQALAKAIDQLVARHDALRSTIEGTETICVHPQMNGHFGWMDVSAQPDPEKAFKDWHQQQAQIPFNLAAGPLFLITLVRMHADTSRLWIRGHHIVLDGLSLNVIVHELAVLYNAALEGTQPKLSPTVSCLDHNRWLQEQTFEKPESYWIKQFETTSDPLSLPSDRPEPAVKTYRGGRITRAIPSALANAIKKYSTANQATHFMTWFSLYALWLHRLSGQSEVVVGMPVAGRSMKGSDDAVGYFTHLIPIRSALSNEDETFPQYLRRMRGLLLRGYEHQDYPFSRLLEHLKTRNTGSTSNLIRAVFNLDRPGDVPQFNGLNVQWTSQPVFHTAFDIVMNLTEVGDALTLECDYASDSFNHDRIEQYLDAFVALATSVSENDPAVVTDIAMMSPTDAQHWLNDWNTTQQELEHGNVVTDWLRSSFRSHAKKVALEWTFDGTTEVLTYTALMQRVDAYTVFLQKRGIEKGDRVAICLERSPELVAVILAVLQAGAVFVPIDPSYPTDRIMFMVHDCDPKLIVTDLDKASLTSDNAVGAPIIVSTAEFTASLSTKTAKPLKVDVSGSDLAYMIYTSGSTGTPKGALIHHQGLSNYLHWATQYYKTDEGDGVLLHAPIAFDATLTSLFAPLLSGTTLCIMPDTGSGLEELMRYVTGAQARDWSLLKITTSHLDLLSAMVPDDQKNGIARCLVLGGEALFSHNIAPWLEHAPSTRIVNEYGPTETVVGCCIYEVTPPLVTDGPIPIGRPIWNTQLFVLDQHRKPVAPGLEGELYIAGDGVGAGYWNRDALTTERFLTTKDIRLSEETRTWPEQPMYRTGDRVRMLADGNIVFLGRTDHQIKLSGYRIEPGEIESVLRSMVGVRQAVVYTTRVAGQDRLVAVVDIGDATIQEAQLRSALSATLPAYMVPTQCIITDHIPVNRHGKIDQEALKQLASRGTQGQDHDSTTGLGDDPIEAKIGAIWSEILGHNQFTKTSNFFEVGGHSMLVLPIKDRLSTHFSISVSPADVFRYPTIQMLATWLSSTNRPELKPSSTSATSTIPERKQRSIPSFKPITKSS